MMGSSLKDERSDDEGSDDESCRLGKETLLSIQCDVLIRFTRKGPCPTVLAEQVLNNILCHHLR